MTKKLVGAEHPDTLISMANLGSTYRDQGRWNEAEQLQIQVMDMTKKIFGADHPDTLTSMENLACTYRDQGRICESAMLELEVMNIKCKKEETESDCNIS